MVEEEERKGGKTVSALLNFSTIDGDSQRLHTLSAFHKTITDNLMVNSFLYG